MIEPKTLPEWRDALIEDGYGPNTVRMRLRALSAALSYALDQGYIAENPFNRYRRKSTLFPPAKDAWRYLSQEEIEKILGKAPESVAKALYFILHTGLRHDELLGLDWKMIHRPKVGPWTMEITRASAHGLGGGRLTKTRRSRIVEIPDQAREAVGAPAESGSVFGWKTRTAIGKQLRLAAQVLGLGPVRVHDFRHTWATNFMYKTGNQFELLYRGGWASVQSAAIYQHLRKRDEALEYPPLPHYFRTKAKNAAARDSGTAA